MARGVVFFVFLINLNFSFGTIIPGVSGVIDFDVNNNKNYEAVLKVSGFGIGTLSPSANLHVTGNVFATDGIIIGSSSIGDSTFNVSGTVGSDHQSVSSNVTLGAYSTVLADTSSNDITLTLPAASSVPGRKYTVKKYSSSNQLTVSGNIDASGGVVFPSDGMGAITVFSNSARWSILEVSGDVTYNAAWTPENADLIMWFDASDASTIREDTVAGRVSQWDDKSGNGNHATAPTTGEEPVYSSADSSVYGTTSHRLNLPATAYSSESEGALVFVGKNGASNDGGWGMYCNYAMSSSKTRFPDSNGDVNSGFCGSARQASSVPVTYTAQTVLLGAEVQTASRYSVRFNGEQVGTDFASTFQSSTTTTRLFSSAQVGEYTLYEMLFIADTADVEKAEGYLAHKWGIEANLPSGHPYKSVAP